MMLTPPTAKSRNPRGIGKAKTKVEVGDVNANHQRIAARIGQSQTMRGQSLYRLQCLRTGCGFAYCDEGIRFAKRRCPACDGGEAARNAPETTESGLFSDCGAMVIE